MKEKILIYMDKTTLITNKEYKKNIKLENNENKNIYFLCLYKQTIDLPLSNGNICKLNNPSYSEF